MSKNVIANSGLKIRNYYLKMVTALRQTSVAAGTARKPRIYQNSGEIVLGVLDSEQVFLYLMVRYWEGILLQKKSKETILRLLDQPASGQTPEEKHYCALLRVFWEIMTIQFPQLTGIDARGGAICIKNDAGKPTLVHFKKGEGWKPASVPYPSRQVMKIIVPTNHSCRRHILPLVLLP